MCFASEQLASGERSAAKALSHWRWEACAQDLFDWRDPGISCLFCLLHGGNGTKLPEGKLHASCTRPNLGCDPGGSAIKARVMFHGTELIGPVQSKAVI